MKYKDISDISKSEMEEIINFVIPGYKIHMLNRSEERVEVTCTKDTSSDKTLILKSDSVLVNKIKVEKNILYRYRQFTIAKGYSLYWKNNQYIEKECKANLENNVCNLVSSHQRKFKENYQKEIDSLLNCYAELKNLVEKNNLCYDFKTFENAADYIWNKLLNYIYVCGIKDSLYILEFSKHLEQKLEGE